MDDRALAFIRVFVTQCRGSGASVQAKRIRLATYYEARLSEGIDPAFERREFAKAAPKLRHPIPGSTDLD